MSAVEKIRGLLEECEILLELAEEARDPASAKEAQDKLDEAVASIRNA